MKADGSEREVFATGIRNTVGFDWLPLTGEFWFTENGRDWLGDALPPDELNRAPNPGMDFGFPYCHGIALPDPEIGTPDACEATTPPVLELGAHVAPLGMAFYTGSLFHPDALNRVFIAEHGSWNSAVPVGYRITLVRLSGNEAESYEPFAEGWLDGFPAWGRSVDILEMPGGALLVSDDRANAIYRIWYAVT
ncbi:MAG: PQQ-dependent sugar dehydrogenase [Methanomicrobiaceae archaeon]|nr:PQQ-dependent sugar dehydrogenase [Methanomicrobiaceae archaeon]